ncbi:aldo/keto reductase [Mycolicibacterium sp.]|uniref:aldo/keto reductase n=1 Tax=Mycolicibacterium sp. TaxID=2320850 RepID=UPI003D0B0FFC
MNTVRELGGSTGIQISAIGLGCMQFSGPGLVSRFHTPLPQPEVDAIVQAALDGGLSWFDTAENYGKGTGERKLATGLTNCGLKPGDTIVATKWSPLGRTAKNLEKTIGNRLEALSPFPIDLYQIHLGFGSFSSVTAQVHALARLVEKGLVRSVGVSNFSASQMVTAHRVLAEHGIPLASNQVRINMLSREIETNGVLDAARRLGITLIAYTPLSSGMLTGKFHSNRKLVEDIALLRRKSNGISNESLDRTQPLIDGLAQVADRHEATVSQVALAWLISYYGDTVVAIAGASKPRHATEAAGVLKLQLSDEELQHLAGLSASVAKKGRTPTESRS